MKKVNIHIGECYSSSEPSIITTILGPCVAVCLFEPVSRTGGMNHILLPEEKSGKSEPGDARYAVNAMEILINQLMKLGADRYKLKAKIFGGAQLFRFMNQELAMGLKNVEVVVDFLINEKIPIVNYNFGGYNSRRIFFYTHTGDVLMQKIKTSEAKSEFGDIQARRKEIEKKIKSTGNYFIFD